MWILSLQIPKEIHLLRNLIGVILEKEELSLEIFRNQRLILYC